MNIKNPMNIKEAMIQLRDDIKTWVTNNIRALAASKADVDHTHNELRRLPAPAISYWYEGELDGSICRLDISSGENVTYEVYCGKDIDGYDGISYEYLALWDSGINPSYFHEIEGYIVDQYETYSGKYSMYIIAKGDGENSFDSDRSNIITFTLELPRVSAPAISVGENESGIPTITFAKISNSTGYSLLANKISGGGPTQSYAAFSFSPDDNLFILDELPIGEWQITVTAKGDNITNRDSISSNAVTVSILPRVTAPTISLTLDGSYIEFENASNNAIGYELWGCECTGMGSDGLGIQSSDYVLLETVDSYSGNTTFTVLYELMTSSKWANFYVIAKGDGVNYDDSLPSNIVFWEK